MELISKEVNKLLLNTEQIEKEVLSILTGDMLKKFNTEVTQVTVQVEKLDNKINSLLEKINNISELISNNDKRYEELNRTIKENKKQLRLIFIITLIASVITLALLVINIIK